MGRSTTPTYRVELTLPGYALTPAAWSVKDSGLANDGNLARYIERWDAIGFGEGLPMVTRARIVHQASGAVVASYNAPMFKAV